MSNWTPEQRRAYAIKKSVQASRKRKRDDGTSEPREPVDGFEVHPLDHRCGIYDIQPGAQGRMCCVCGRRWMVAKGGYDASGRWKTYGTESYQVSPLSVAMPPASPPRPSSSIKTELPLGQLGELPPDDVVGAARGAWWKDYTVERVKTLRGSR